MKQERIVLLDALRGLAVILMVVHHFLYDLTEFCGAPDFLFSNPVFDVLHYLFAGLFVLLCGISSDFSHSNAKRGAKAMLCALAVTLVTYFLDLPICFGVLHMLASCMLLFALTRKFWEALPFWLVPTVSLVGIMSTYWLVNGVTVQTPYLFPLGFVTEDFFSADYFPLLPWFFVFLLGTWLGRPIKAGKFPKWFYAFRVPFFPTVGRHALLIYLLHQPVLYGIVLLGQQILH